MLFIWTVLVLMVGCKGAELKTFDFTPFEDSYRTSKVVNLKDKHSGQYGDNKKVNLVFHTPSEYYQQNYKPYDDGYENSWKTLRSEKYETETIDNPHSEDPASRYVVKGKYKVIEKLPYEDTTHGYDHEYEYPLTGVDTDYHKSAKLIDFESAKNDPFGLDHAEIKKEVEYISQDKKKPKELTYHYQYPHNDYDYKKNVKLVNFYLAKNKQDEKKLKDHGYNDLDYLPLKTGLADELYHKYKSDDHSFEYLDDYDYDDKRKKRGQKNKFG